jgi:competence protein ComEC
MDISPAIFTSIISKYLPEPQSSLLNGIVFGVDLKTTKSFYQQLKIVGLLHLVVLSGSNITLIGTVVGGLTSYFSKRLSILITVLTIISFVIFVGPKAPIVRAGIMGVLTYVAILTGRKNVVIYSLILSAIFIGLVFPEWLTSISMQLSYGATLGLILFGKKDFKNPILGELRTSLAAQFFTAPLIFIYLKQISFISPLANLLVAPVISPLMIFGFLTAFLGKIHYLAGLLPAYICYGLLTYMVWIIETLSKVPFAFYQFGK